MALFMLVVDFSVMRVLLYKRAWLKKKIFLCPKKSTKNGQNIC